MTEVEWLACADPGEMLRAIRPALCGRKLRLLAAACCRCMTEDMRVHESVGRLMDAVEAFADGETTRAALDRVAAETSYEPPGYDWVTACRWAAGPLDGEGDATARVAHTAASGHVELLFRHVSLIGQVEAQRRAGAAESAAQAEFVRDVFSNPFRPVAFSHEWRSSTTVALARTMYEAREFSAMPILADALQDAGCDSDDVLNHCRGSRPHVKGCWVCDLVMVKE